MSALHQAAAVVFLLFGAFVVHQALGLHLTADHGPGPGFFAFCLGIVLAILAVIDGVATRRGGVQRLPPGFIPDRDGLRRVLAIVGALVAALLLLPSLGFTPTMFLFAVFLLRMMGRQAWWVTLLVALVGSVGTFYLFSSLQVLLPTGFLGI